jgi:hypothetical protein
LVLTRPPRMYSGEQKFTYTPLIFHFSLVIENRNDICKKVMLHIEVLMSLVRGGYMPA